jgi:hypothetical protein
MINIHIKVKDWEYEFDIIRKFTIIFDKSGTGKTNLYRLIELYRSNDKIVKCIKTDNGEKLRCDNFSSEEDIKSDNRIDEIKKFFDRDVIVFIDEDEPLLNEFYFLELIKDAKATVVIINREVRSLIYGISNIYRMRSAGRFHYLENYFDFSNCIFRKPNVVITEDSGSGFEFYKKLFNKKGVKVISSFGKKKMAEMINQHINNVETVLAVFDGCGIGNSILENYFSFTNPRVQCFAEESFEWVLLISEVYRKSIPNESLWILDPHSDERFLVYEYEKFLTELLVKITQSETQCGYIY